jgi:peptide/nickel transport system permease protein
MRPSKAVVLPLVCLAVIHTIVGLAGFFGPYDPAAQNREVPSCPPTRLHWVDRDGGLHLRPFVYGLAEPTGETEQCAEVLHGPYPIQLLVRGTQYRILGVLTSDRHLFGVAAPGHVYVMGTDNYGRDVLSRVLYGGQISLFAGLLATLLSLILGLLLGTLAGFYGGWRDGVIMRGVELFLALPWLYLLLALRAFLPLHTGPRQTFLLLIAVIGFVGWARPARIIRGVVLSAKERSHLLAARSFGGSDLYLLRHHVLPETRSVVLTQAALLIPHYVLAEVTLSFLGLGVSEPIASWGSMLATLQQYHILVSNWWMFYPGVALVLVFLSYGVLSNALQADTAKHGVKWNAYSSLE